MAEQEEGKAPPQYQAGWYPDPERPGQRYYDGEKWTDHFAPPAQQPVPQGGRVRDPKNDGLAGIGYLLAVLFPFIGIIIGIVLVGRNDPRGGSVIGVAISVWLVVFALLFGAGLASR